MTSGRRPGPTSVIDAEAYRGALPRFLATMNVFMRTSKVMRMQSYVPLSKPISHPRPWRKSKGKPDGNSRAENTDA